MEKKLKTLSIRSKEIDVINYAIFLEHIKTKINQAQVKAALAVNSELIQLYWDIGQSIVEKQEKEGWKAQVIENLCKDIQKAFPGIQGFSRLNIFNMRSFYLAYSRVQQPVGFLKELPIVRIPWGHNILLIQKISNIDERLWYAKQTVEHGLSRNALEDWIQSKSFKRHGKAVTNFSAKLPAPHSKLAQETLKDPYNFDFLTLTSDYCEQDLEKGLVDHIQKLLLELGKGFAFLGRQYHVEIAEDDYYLDLLFYNINLRCFCVVELKNTEFKPEYAGKMNFYLSAVDDQLKRKEDNPSIGIILWKTNKRLKVEYALRDIIKPVGVAQYTTKMMESLPKNLKKSLPTIEEFEAEIEKQETCKKLAGAKQKQKKKA